MYFLFSALNKTMIASKLLELLIFKILFELKLCASPKKPAYGLSPLTIVFILFSTTCIYLLINFSVLGDGENIETINNNKPTANGVANKMYL